MADQQVDEAPRTAAASLGEDRFDRLPKGRRVGAHRLVARPRRFWVYLVSALLGVALLTGAGIFWVQNVGGGSSSGLDQGGQLPLVNRTEPEIDPGASVAVLNGTAVPGLEVGVADAIAANGWGQIGFTEVAATNEVQISAVFYTAAEDEAAALGLAAELGGVSTYQSEDYAQYGVRLVVLIGADYAGPGAADPAA